MKTVDAQCAAIPTESDNTTNDCEASFIRTTFEVCFAIYVVLYVTGALSVFTGNIDSFRYEQNVTPLTNPYFVYGIISFYVVSIFFLQKYMKDKPPLDVKYFTIVHNFILVVLSGYLTYGISSVVFPYIYKNGFRNSFCNPELHNNGYLHMLYYLNYLLKFYEHIDTYILIVKKKNVIFLHWYHHALTAILTYVQQNTYTTVQWVPILANVFVHVMMYSYYLFSSLKINVWWKQYITQLQILQFVIDITICAYTAIQLYTYPDTCPGQYSAIWTGIPILSSYLVLFLDFFKKSYLKKKVIKTE
ncbi:hypothetical protein WA158_005027 [Blastocystis sp. Blastoise]